MRGRALFGCEQLYLVIISSEQPSFLGLLNDLLFDLRQ